MAESSNKVKAIGGYFELELRSEEHYHKNALRLNTDRNAFEYILKARNYKKVYIPYYTCEVMLQPLLKLDINYEFYHINKELEPVNLPILKTNEAFLYTNYFGIKQNCVIRLAQYYGTQLIVDNAQAFFDFPVANIDTFYSTRKFFGVPDGAYLYTTCKLDLNLEQDKSYMRMQHLLKRIDEGAESAYDLFRQNDSALDNQPIKLMSKLTERLLANIDYQHSKEIRIKNYNIIHNILSPRNKLNLSLKEGEAPMIYPFYNNNSSLRKKLIDSKIFVAKYWSNVLQWCPKDSLEYDLAENMIPIPIDQRYNENDMQIIIKTITL